MSDKVKTYMTRGSWILHLEIQKNTSNEQIGDYSNQILALQIKCRKLQVKIDECNKIERGAWIAEVEGMGVRYFLEDDSFCYESYNKGELGFRSRENVE